MCPVCKRDLAPTLSICLTCGAMMNDTVREELHSKIAPASEPVKVRVKSALPAVPVRQLQLETVSAVKPVSVKIDTTDLAIKKTSPTLVDFQNKNAALPDWRLQLQNTVRQRNGVANRETSSPDAAPAVYQKQLVTSGANALKVEYVEETKPAVHENLKVANALKRIEDSRRVFFTEENKESEQIVAAKPVTGKNFPFNVVSRSSKLPEKRAETNATVYAAAKPRLVSSLRIEKKGFDTNKLPPLPQPAKIATSFHAENSMMTDDAEIVLRDEKSVRIQIKAPLPEPGIAEIEQVDSEIEIDEIDDLAPLSIRFNAGLFDLALGGFASFILLSPFMLTGESWLSFSGFFAFAASFAIVMFVYLTVSLSFIGRTFGMKLFSLELIDAEENAYPTLHQAAVSSSVYLLSLAFGGIGLLPVFFNEEKRAAHDIASGTILIKEY